MDKVNRKGSCVDRRGKTSNLQEIFPICLLKLPITHTRFLKIAYPRVALEKDSHGTKFIAFFPMSQIIELLWKNALQIILPFLE